MIRCECDCFASGLPVGLAVNFLRVGNTFNFVVSKIEFPDIGIPVKVGMGENELIPIGRPTRFTTRGTKCGILSMNSTSPYCDFVVGLARCSHTNLYAPLLAFTDALSQLEMLWV